MQSAEGRLTNSELRLTHHDVLNSQLCILHSAFGLVRFSLRCRPPSPYATLHPSPFTLHPSLFTLHSSPFKFPCYPPRSTLNASSRGDSRSASHPKTLMKNIIFIATTLFAVHAHAAMLQVVAIEDGRTITVARDASRQTIRLAGIATTDELHARELLEWTILGVWVLVEPSPAGGHLVWRSPDALFINRELVERGYARATAVGIAPEPRLMVTYLGQLQPFDRARESRTVTRDRRSGNGSDTRRRSPGARGPRGRAAATGEAPAGARAAGRSSGSRTRAARPPRSSD